MRIQRKTGRRIRRMSGRIFVFHNLGAEPRSPELPFVHSNIHPSTYSFTRLTATSCPCQNKRAKEVESLLEKEDCDLFVHVT